MKTKLIILALNVIAFSTVAQSIKRSVVGTAGIANTSGTTTLRSTTGETFTNKYTTANTTLSQGFQQGKLTVLRVADESTAIVEKDFKFNVFPNPVAEFATIETIKELPDNCTVMLAEITGRILYENRLINQSMKLDFSNYKSGQYIIIVQTGEKRESFKVVKQ